MTVTPKQLRDQAALTGLDAVADMLRAAADQLEALEWRQVLPAGVRLTAVLDDHGAPWLTLGCDGDRISTCAPLGSMRARIYTKAIEKGLPHA